MLKMLRDKDGILQHPLGLYEQELDQMRNFINQQKHQHGIQPEGGRWYKIFGLSEGDTHDIYNWGWRVGAALSDLSCANYAILKKRYSTTHSRATSAPRWATHRTFGTSTSGLEKRSWYTWT